MSVRDWMGAAIVAVIFGAIVWAGNVMEREKRERGK
jgi:hypothetical protein